LQKSPIDITNEGRAHTGESLYLLHGLDPYEKMFYKQGAQEVKEEIEKF
jgi:hypothetical protein